MNHRSKRGPERPYFSVERTPAQDEDLSLEALGVLIYLLSKPDDWEPSAADIARRGKFTRQKAYKLLNDLQECGYAARRQERVQGRITRWIMDVFESPVLLVGKQEVEKTTCSKKQEVEKTTCSKKQEVEKRTLHIKDKYIRQKTHKEQNTHTTEAPDGAGGVVSSHSLPICQQYAQHLHDTGQGINNPGGFADAIYDGPKAGRYDAAIAAWLAAPGQPQPKKMHDDPNCPRCQGYGQEYVGGEIGMQRCTAGD